MAEQSIDHLATTLRKGGVKDLLAFFPPNKRSDKVLDEYFRKEGLHQVAEWWTKRQNAALKEGVISTIKEMIGNEESHDDVSWITINMLRFSEDLCRLSLLSRTDSKSSLFQTPNWFTASGKASSLPLTGVPVRTRTKHSLSARSPCVTHAVVLISSDKRL